MLPRRCPRTKASGRNVDGSLLRERAGAYQPLATRRLWATSAMVRGQADLARREIRLPILAAGSASHSLWSSAPHHQISSAFTINGPKPEHSVRRRRAWPKVIAEPTAKTVAPCSGFQTTIGALAARHRLVVGRCTDRRRTACHCPATSRVDGSHLGTIYPHRGQRVLINEP